MGRGSASGKECIDGFDIKKLNSFEVLTEIAKKRSMKLKGDEYDVLRAAEMLLSDFRNGKLGKISLERPR